MELNPAINADILEDGNLTGAKDAAPTERTLYAKFGVKDCHDTFMRDAYRYQQLSHCHSLVFHNEIKFFFSSVDGSTFNERTFTPGLIVQGPVPKTFLCQT